MYNNILKPFIFNAFEKWQLWTDRDKIRWGENIEEGAKNLKLLASKIDTTKMKAPSFLMILTGTTKYAIRREDGVYIVPIGCLKD